MREAVNFLIGIQSPVLPGGLSLRKLAVVVWAELRLQWETADSVRSVDGRER